MRTLLWLLGLPAFGLTAWLLALLHADTVICLAASAVALMVWAIAVSLYMEQMIRPLQTLSNVVAALREDDYSFRARGARRDAAVGDLALEVNA